MIKFSVMCQIAIVCCVIYATLFSNTQEDIVKGFVSATVFIFATGISLWVEKK